MDTFEIGDVVCIPNTYVFQYGFAFRNRRFVVQDIVEGVSINTYMCLLIVNHSYILHRRMEIQR